MVKVILYLESKRYLADKIFWRYLEIEENKHGGKNCKLKAEKDNRDEQQHESSALDGIEDEIARQWETKNIQLALLFEGTTWWSINDCQIKRITHLVIKVRDEITELNNSHESVHIIINK